MPDFDSLMRDVMRFALDAGADYADCYAYETRALSTEIRQGKTDFFEREEDFALGLRVIVGQSSACLSTSSLETNTLKTLAENAVSMARHIPEDRGLQRPNVSQAAKNLDKKISALNLIDPKGEPQAKELEDMAQTLEEIGLSHNGITNSEGAEASWSSSLIHLSNSFGFYGHYRKDYTSCSLSLIAGEGTQMERDYAYDSVTQREDLDPLEDIAHKAVHRTLSRLNPRDGKTGSFPVIYDSRVARSLLYHYLNAINGSRIVKGTSFLQEKMDQPVFGKDIQIIDDPLLPAMPRSKPFDAEMQEAQRLMLVQDGKIQNWLLDLRTSKKLGMENNSRASRGLASQPSPGSTNSWIENGNQSKDDIIAEIKDGLYITELMGSSISLTSGEYSRGASGFWIENGKIAYPVSELTIAGNLNDIFAQAIPANDLRLRYGSDSPSIFIPEMTVASAKA
jgi:PmbA protein